MPSRSHRQPNRAWQRAYRRGRRARTVPGQNPYRLGTYCWIGFLCGKFGRATVRTFLFS